MNRPTPALEAIEGGENNQGDSPACGEGPQKNPPVRRLGAGVYLLLVYTGTRCTTPGTCATVGASPFGAAK